MSDLKKLQKLFNSYKIDGYIIPKNDEFFGEYVDKSNERLKYLTGFSGSAGQALILKKKAFLFVDGRYTLQAKKEVNIGLKVIEIHKTKPKDILKKDKRKLIIGFDPKLYTENILKNLFITKNIKFIAIKNNLVDKIWLNKPKLKLKKFFILKKKHVGEDYDFKIRKICNLLKKLKIKNLLITAPENVAWILNIRGNDSYFSPIPNCNAIINYKKKNNSNC